jgi:hypothetical protein
MTEREGQIPEEFNFDRDSYFIEELLVGATFIKEDRKVSVSELQGYSNEDNQRGVYRRLLNEEPGTIVVLPVHGHPISCIVTRNGGCVTIDAIDFERDGSMYNTKGKGRVASELGFEKGQKFRLTQDNPQENTFRLEEIDMGDS